MATKKMDDAGTDLMTAYKAVLFDVPLAGTRWGLGLGGDKDATQAAWTGYDATVRVVTKAVDAFYRAPRVGELTALVLDSVLRWHQVGDALTRTAMIGLAQAAGLPTASEVKAVRSEVHALRDEVRALRSTLAGKATQQKGEPAVGERTRQPASVNRMAA